MWLITPIGFFSIVQKSADAHSDTLTVRSRVRADLERMREQYLPSLSEIQEGGGTDYKFRAQAPRAEVGAAMARLVETLDYSNFKTEVGQQQGHERAHLYSEVWGVLNALQSDARFGEE